MHSAQRLFAVTQIVDSAKYKATVHAAKRFPSSFPESDQSDCTDMLFLCATYSYQLQQHFGTFVDLNSELDLF